MSYVIQQGSGQLTTFYSEKFGRDHGAAFGWVRDRAQATAFATEDDAFAQLERMPFDAPNCRIVVHAPHALQSAPAVDHYAVLGLKPGASAREIKAAFRRLAMKHHPDRPDGDEARFRSVRAAYEALVPTTPTAKRAM